MLGEKMSVVQDSIEIKFRLIDGSDIGTKRFLAATSVATLKESVFSQWPKGSVKMLKSLVSKDTFTHKILNGSQFKQQRGLHSRNKLAMEYIAKGWNALKEVERVIDFCEPKDKHLIPHLNTAKNNFEMALEVDNTSTHARYWLSKLHLKYHVPGQCKAMSCFVGGSCRYG